MPPRRRSAALVPLLPLAFLATACGGIGHGWAGHAKTASDSPVGNSGTPNTGITAQALAERAATANREARGVRGEFSGTVYGERISGDTLITARGDSESHVRVKGRGMHVLVVGDHTYTRAEPGLYKALFEVLGKAPGFDADTDEPSEGMAEFMKLMEGKYLRDDKGPDDSGFLVFDGFLDEGPFESGDSGGSGSDPHSDPDSDSGDDDDYDDYGDDGTDDYGDSDDDSGADSGAIALSLGEPTKIGGIEVIPLIATARDDGTTSISTMYLPAHGTPLPVRLTSDEDNDGRIDATIDTRYFGVDDGRTVTAPKDEDSVDLDEAFEGMFGRDEPWDRSDAPYDGGGGVTA
ncbi:hypothetical protein LO772_14800 [Yinghuangia sp. ASG 101]|uniref:hypothetical protein n=1 Tax=Yinghuangia sp. ASG 101 TaxID=2896848 RepID=UPI001E3C96AB|nr:hypothetical protein [Yinghuangia sp. ASG 101]UGQ14730.1 hypothetical protein LO772_14800 [Yinghuangia sp. ASG 101]